MKEEKINYKKLKLKCGLEIHQQLDTKNKLFCHCSTGMQEREPIKIVTRKQHPVASELGKVDTAAQYEYFRNRTFLYQVFKNESCLVELDEEPPHPLNQEALRIALEVALLLNCEIPNEIQIMRKTVIDGSNTGGFQRTAIVGLNGFAKCNGKKIEITHVALEEDAAAIVKEENGNVTYRLNRLGVPLVEIGTGLLEGFNPEDIQEIAYTIGMICRSTGKVKHGIGTIRQDVNVSIKNGRRVEIKGVQELGLLSKIVELEVQRQLELPRVEEETRTALEDGTTKFMRPLPGAERMYPETDIVPVPVSKELIKEIEDKLPEPWTKKLGRFKSKLKLSDQLAKEILRSEYLELFERIVENRKVNASVAANTFTALLKDLKKREKVEIEKLNEKHFVDLFEQLAKGKIVKEAIPEILKHLAKKSELPVTEVIKDLNLSVMKKSELVKIVRKVAKENPEMTRDKILGIVMSNVRGRIEAEEVMKAVRKIKK